MGSREPLAAFARVAVAVRGAEIGAREPVAVERLVGRAVDEADRAAAEHGEHRGRGGEPGQRRPGSLRRAASGVRPCHATKWTKAESETRIQPKTIVAATPASRFFGQRQVTPALRFAEQRREPADQGEQRGDDAHHAAALERPVRRCSREARDRRPCRASRRPQTRRPRSVTSTSVASHCDSFERTETLRGQRDLLACRRARRRARPGARAPDRQDQSARHQSSPVARPPLRVEHGDGDRAIRTAVRAATRSDAGGSLSRWMNQ